MKLSFLRLVLSLLVSVSAVLSYSADFDWLRAAVAGYDAYKAYTLTDKDLTAYVKQTVQYMDRSNKVLPESSPYTQRLKRLTAGLKKVNGVTLNFKVYYVKDEVNAFACPDGSVRVYSSLMDLMSDDELLGVIGHEIGHVGKHHSRKAIKNQLYTGALREAVASSESTLGALANSELGALSEVFLTSHYSRTQEKEADDYGYEFLKKSGKNPWAMIQALQKLQSLEKQSPRMAKYISNMFSSHPDTKERISRLKERYKRDGYKRPNAK